MTHDVNGPDLSEDSSPVSDCTEKEEIHDFDNLDNVENDELDDTVDMSLKMENKKIQTPNTFAKRQKSLPSIILLNGNTGPE